MPTDPDIEHGDTMRQIFYLSKYDMLIQVKYSTSSEVIVYTTHRKINSKEQKAIEKNLTKNLNDSTDASLPNPTIHYFGTDKTLLPKLIQFRAIRTFHISEEKQRGRRGTATVETVLA
jgi:hypothetical protein